MGNHAHRCAFPSLERPAGCERRGCTCQPWLGFAALLAALVATLSCGDVEDSAPVDAWSTGSLDAASSPRDGRAFAAAADAGLSDAERVADAQTTPAPWAIRTTKRDADGERRRPDGGPNTVDGADAAPADAATFGPEGGDPVRRWCSGLRCGRSACDDPDWSPHAPAPFPPGVSASFLASTGLRLRQGERVADVLLIVTRDAHLVALTMQSEWIEVARAPGVSRLVGAWDPDGDGIDGAIVVRHGEPYVAHVAEDATFSFTPIDEQWVDAIHSAPHPDGRIRSFVRQGDELLACSSAQGDVLRCDTAMVLGAGERWVGAAGGQVIGGWEGLIVAALTPGRRLRLARLAGRPSATPTSVALDPMDAAHGDLIGAALVDIDGDGMATLVLRLSAAFVLVRDPFGAARVTLLEGLDGGTPAGVGDRDGDGVFELLVRGAGRLVVRSIDEWNAPDPSRRVLLGDGPAHHVDLDGDGVDELLVMEPSGTWTYRVGSEGYEGTSLAAPGWARDASDGVEPRVTIDLASDTPQAHVTQNGVARVLDLGAGLAMPADEDAFAPPACSGARDGTWLVCMDRAFLVHAEDSTPIAWDALRVLADAPHAFLDVDADGRDEFVVWARASAARAFLGDASLALGSESAFLTFDASERGAELVAIAASSAAPAPADATLDLDGDGADEWVLFREGGAVAFARGSAETHPWPASGAPLAFAAMEDFDGDGALDRLIVDARGRVALTLGSEGRAREIIAADQWTVDALQLGHIDADPGVDVVLSELVWNPDGTRTTRLWQLDTDRELGVRLLASLPGPSTLHQLADLDGDAIPDLLVSTPSVGLQLARGRCRR